MLIRHFSTGDIEGGAARAAFRLHTALRESGHRSQMIVRFKRSDDNDVLQLPPLFHGRWRTEFNRLKKHIPGMKPHEIRPDYEFNFDRAPEVDLQPLFKTSPAPNDIICLHWINGLLDSQSIHRIYDHFRSPLVWVIHDLEPFTGGCHYSFGCHGFTEQCGACPRIGSTDKDDHSHQTWLRKKKYLSELPICFVAPTGWGEARVRESSLFRHTRVERIPLPLNTRVFRLFDKRVAREVMQLPLEKKIILFGATYLEDRRKGVDLLIKSFDMLASLIDNHFPGGRQGQPESVKRNDIFLLAVGLNGNNLMQRLPFSGRYTGHISDELMMALAYQSADIFVCPSLEDSGPMMIPEAMLCGTPVVAFNNGGAPDLIRTMKNGYLAELADASDLARGIHALLLSDSLPSMRNYAREAAEMAHSPPAIVSRHIALYQSLQNYSSE